MGDSASGRGGYTRTMRLPTLAGVVFAMAVQAGPPQTTGRAFTAVLPEAPPALTVGAGEVVFEATVGPEGTVEQIDKLRATAPFTDLVASAVEGWRFVPATIVKDGRAWNRLNPESSWSRSTDRQP